MTDPPPASLMPDPDLHAAVRPRLEPRGAALARVGLCLDEGLLSFVTFICCPYRDSPYKRELGGRMTKFPRLSRP
jgi:hypothetical protein